MDSDCYILTTYCYILAYGLLYTGLHTGICWHTYWFILAYRLLWPEILHPRLGLGRNLQRKKKEDKRKGVEYHFKEDNGPKKGSHVRK